MPGRRLNNLVPRRDLNILAKRLDRLIANINSSNAIVREDRRCLDPNSWSVRIVLRDGGFVMRTLSETGNRVTESYPGTASFPCRVFSITQCTIVDVFSRAGGVISYHIENSPSDFLTPQRDITLEADPSVLSGRRTYAIEQWITELFPAMNLWRMSPNTKYHFAKVDSSSFLASLVTQETTYNNIVDLLIRYLGIKENKEQKLIGEVIG